MAPSETAEASAADNGSPRAAVSWSRTRGDRAAAAPGGRLHDRADVAEERLHNLAWPVRWQFVQVTADVLRVAPGGFQRELLFAARLFDGDIVKDASIDLDSPYYN